MQISGCSISVVDMFDIVNPKNSCPVPLYKIFPGFLFLQGMVRGGTDVTTVDPADLRGLGTAWLISS